MIRMTRMMRRHVCSALFFLLPALLAPLAAGCAFESDGKDSPDAQAAAPATITRDRHSKAVTLRVDARGPWSLFEIATQSYAGEKNKTAEAERLLLAGNGPGVFEIPFGKTKRGLFGLRTQEKDFNKDFIMAERLLPLSGGYNFRDLGGYAGADGRQVAWGKLIRSDDLKSLTQLDRVYLESIPLLTVVDFRTAREAAEAPDRLPDTVKNSRHLPIMPGNLNRDDYRGADTPEQQITLMETLYESIVTDNVTVEQYRKFFELIQQDEQAPLLFHCSAGKDRTGIAAALILTALGVDSETIMQDYLASNEHLQGKYPSDSLLYQVRPEFLVAARRAVEREYGSVESFLKDVLGVDMGRMRELYLE